MSYSDWGKYENICLICGAWAEHWIGCGCLISMKTFVFGYCSEHFSYEDELAASPGNFAKKGELICSDHEDRQSHYFDEQIIAETS